MCVWIAMNKYDLYMKIGDYMESSIEGTDGYE